MSLAILAFLLSLLISYSLTPLIIKIALKLKIVDHPHEERKIHSEPTPYLGGIVIYLGFLIPVLLFLGIDKKVFGILLGGFFLIILGLLDDVWNLPAKVKLGGQILAALILIFFGIKIIFITNPWGGVWYLGSAGIFLTIIWVVGITNALNLIDGLDGLCAGVAAIACLILFLITYQQNFSLPPLILYVSLGGSSLGFLRYNFYPAKIFMGDSGAYFLGFVLSAIAVLGAYKSATLIALFGPILVLAVPIFDTLSSIVRRIRSGQPSFQADKEHLHHKLLEQGLTQKQTVLTIYLVTIFLGFMALLLIKGG